MLLLVMGWLCVLFFFLNVTFCCLAIHCRMWTLAAFNGTVAATLVPPILASLLTP